MTVRAIPPIFGSGRCLWIRKRTQSSNVSASAAHRGFHVTSKHICVSFLTQSTHSRGCCLLWPWDKGSRSAPESEGRTIPARPGRAGYMSMYCRQVPAGTTHSPMSPARSGDSAAGCVVPAGLHRRANRIRGFRPGLEWRGPDGPYLRAIVMCPGNPRKSRQCADTKMTVPDVKIGRMEEIQ